MAADKPHEAYINAVAGALKVAGFKVLDWNADGYDPRDGTINIQPVGVFADLAADELRVNWSEEHGWDVATVMEGAGWNNREGRAEDARTVYDLQAGRVPSPETVARAVADMANVDANVPVDAFPDLAFADHSWEDDDPDFEAALAAYRTEGGAE